MYNVDQDPRQSVLCPKTLSGDKACSHSYESLLSFGLYLVGAQALSRLDVERVPQQLPPHHVHGHNALLQRSARWCSRSGHRGKLQKEKITF